MSFFSYIFGKDFSSRRTINGVVAVQHSDTKQTNFAGIIPGMMVFKEGQEDHPRDIAAIETVCY